MKDKEPSEWLKKALAGDQVAYKAFLQWVSDFTYMVAGRRFYQWRLNSKELLDDFVQEVLISVHNKRHTYLTTLPVEPWVAGIIRYKTIDWLRKVARENRHLSFEDPLGPAYDSHSSSDEDAGEMMAGSDIETMLSTLGEKQRGILELAKIEGLSIQEIAKSTGSSESAVKVTIHRAIKNLQKKFGGNVD